HNYRNSFSSDKLHKAQIEFKKYKKVQQRNIIIKKNIVNITNNDNINNNNNNNNNSVNIDNIELFDSLKYLSHTQLENIQSNLDINIYKNLFEYINNLKTNTDEKFVISKTEENCY